MRKKARLNLNVIMRWYTILVVLPVLILAVAVSWNVWNSSRGKQAELAREQMNSVIVTAEMSMSNVANLFNLVCFDMEVINFFSQPYEADSYYIYNDKILPRIKLIQTASNSGVSDLTVYMKNETIPEGYGMFEHFSRDTTAEELETLLENTGGRWLTDRADDNRKLCYIQGIYAAYSDELLAIVEAEISPEWLLFSNQNFQDEIWVSDEELLYTNSVEEMPASLGEFRRTKQHIIMSRDFSSLGLKLVLRTKEDSPYQYMAVYILLFLGFLAASMLVYLFLLRGVVRDANNMICQIRRSVDHDFNEYVVTESRFELAVIAEKFNEIVEQIHLLIDDSVEKKLAQREAQITAMQCQINPHMLCNSLQIIQYQLEMNQQYDISRSVAILGKIMRYGIDNKSIMTSVELEVEHLNLYMEFQKLRFDPGEVEFEVDADENLNKCSMIKLTLQPIVENALIHGKRKGQPIRVTVRVYKKENRIRFEIINTGKKQSKEELDNMRRQLHEPESSAGRSSIGLTNINRRNTLFYSEKSELQIGTDEEGNTKIAFEIPYGSFRQGGDESASIDDFG